MTFFSFNAQHESFNQEFNHGMKQREAVNSIMRILKNHYQEILGIPDTNQTPQPKNVISAYRKIALLIHLDKCKEPNAKAAFQRIFRSSFLDFSLTH